jgi:hypothetical protein
MALKVNEVTRLVAITGPEEMIEADFQKRGQRRICRNVATDAGVFLVLAMHHGHRVPANQALDAAFQLAIAGIGNFLFDRNGIDVGCVELDWNFHSRFTGAMNEGIKQFTASIFSLAFDHLVKGFQPFRNFFFRVDLWARRKLKQLMYFLCGHWFLDDG